MTEIEVKNAAEKSNMNVWDLLSDWCPFQVGAIVDESIGCDIECEMGLRPFKCIECWKKAELLNEKQIKNIKDNIFMENEDSIEKGLEKLRKQVSEKSEQVNHPQHYTQPGRRECIEEMRIVFGDKAVKQWCVMTAYKYRYRTGNKEGNSTEQDNRKAEWYLDYAEGMGNV